MIPLYGINWPTLRDRLLRWWELAYNILICKIPSHTLRLLWLRIGGAKIGKGSTVWRNTEVLGVDSLRIGNDSTVGWHCQLDARGGLIIGDHVTIASHVLIIAGGHDVQAPEFWAVGGPVYIRDYAWIASRALLSFGADIGEGAVVGGQCVVSKPVPAYAIVGGPDAAIKGERCRGLNSWPWPLACSVRRRCRCTSNARPANRPTGSAHWPRACCSAACCWAVC